MEHDLPFKQLLTFIIGGVLFAGVLLYVFLFTAPVSFPQHEVIKVAEGSSVKEIGERLAEENIIRSSFLFRILTKLEGTDTGVVSGAYYFNDRHNLFAVSGRLTRGEHGILPVRVTVLEGHANHDIAQILDGLLPEVDAQEFLKEARNFEGYLFPDTYLFLPTVDAGEVVDTMRDNFDEKIKVALSDIKESDRSFEEIIIMASILEKEAWKSEDRKKIAGVLWKRYDAGMPLQVDATLTYVVGRNTYELTQDDLDFDSPYNTYKYPGLPAGPIANPGLDAILSAIHYEENPYWYYLADRSGNTYYAETFEEHVENKRKHIN